MIEKGNDVGGRTNAERTG